MEQIFHNKKLVALKITKIPKGSIPLTDSKESLQIVSLNHPKGAVLKAHMHEPKERVTPRLQECLIVKKGKIKADLYSTKKRYFKSVFISEGQALLLIDCGIGIKMMKDSEVLEFKNGPFVEDKVLI